eukprot:359186-Chlamydomonas_euryale.AAC.2
MLQCVWHCQRCTPCGAAALPCAVHVASPALQPCTDGSSSGPELQHALQARASLAAFELRPCAQLSFRPSSFQPTVPAAVQSSA